MQLIFWGSVCDNNVGWGKHIPNDRESDPIAVTNLIAENGDNLIDENNNNLISN